jgi:hypothetical protein
LMKHCEAASERVRNRLRRNRRESSRIQATEVTQKW